MHQTWLGQLQQLQRAGPLHSHTYGLSLELTTAYARTSTSCSHVCPFSNIIMPQAYNSMDGPAAPAQLDPPRLSTPNPHGLYL